MLSHETLLHRYFVGSFSFPMSLIIFKHFCCSVKNCFVSVQKCCIIEQVKVPSAPLIMHHAKMPYRGVAVQLWVLTSGSRWNCVVSSTNTPTTLPQGKQPQLPFVQEVPEPIWLQSEKPLPARVGTLNLWLLCLSLICYTDWTTQLTSWL